MSAFPTRRSIRGCTRDINHALLILVTGLLMWGLPSVRFTPRTVDAAFNGIAAMDFTAWFQVGTCAFAGLVVFVKCAARIRKGLSPLPTALFRGPTASFLAYSVVAFASAVYSISAAFTIYSASKILLLLLSSALLVRDYGGGMFAARVCLRLFYTVNILQWIVIAVLFCIAPDLAGIIDPKVGYRLNGGIFGDYGRAAAFSGVYFLAIALRSHGGKRWLPVVGYALSWMFVLLSLTRGTMIFAAVVMCVMVAAKYRARARLLLTCATFGVLGCIIFSGALDEILTFSARGESRADLQSLTGRAQAFHFLVAGWRESPILGLGYGAGNRYLLLHFQEQAGLAIGAAHDAVSRVLADLGLVGAALLLIATVHLCIATYGMWRHTKRNAAARELAVQFVGLLIYILIFSVISSGIAEVPAQVALVALATRALHNQSRRVAVLRTASGSRPALPINDLCAS